MSKYDKLKNKNKILINPEIIKKIDATTEQEFKSIQLKNLCGLQLIVSLS